MPSSDQEMQDQRTISGMEDTNTMTIEFLRARLLYERSVSKSARQRADELASQVAELEEQLKIVSLQRKKAEKATTDVLAILESNGISEISDAYDSSSNQETPSESKVNFNEGEEKSVESKFKRNKSVEVSGSENEFSLAHQRALSWNGRRSTKQTLEKYKDSYLRRSSFASTGSFSPKNRRGKSCRQIRQRESKSLVEEPKRDPVNFYSQQNGVATSLNVDGKPETLRGSEVLEENYSREGSDSGCLENGNLVSNGDRDFNGLGRDKDMLKALDDQAQLTGRYEEMEKAQKEWEERFRENNNSTQEFCDPGNQSDVTEEGEEIKSLVQCLAGTVNSQVQEAKSEVYVSSELPKTQSNSFLPPHGDMQRLGDQKCGSTPASESLAQEFAFPMSIEKQNRESMENNHYVPSHSSNHHVHSHGFPENLSSQFVSSNISSSSGGEVPGSQIQHYALVTHKTNSGFNEVLEALKLARLSLQKKMSGFPLTESGSVGKAIESSLPASKVWDGVEIPVGFSGLFRVPTDYAVEVSKANFPVSGSQPSLANYNPTSSRGLVSDQIVSNSFIDTRSTFSADNIRPTGDQFLSKPSLDKRSSYSTEDQLLTSQYSDTRSRISTVRPSSDSNLDAGLPLSRQYTHPSFSTHPGLTSQLPNNERFSFLLPSRSVGKFPNLNVGLSPSSQYTQPNFSPDQMPQVATHEGLSTLRPSRSDQMSPANHMQFHNDPTRPYMYR